MSCFFVPLITPFSGFQGPTILKSLTYVFPRKRVKQRRALHDLKSSMEMFTSKEILFENGVEVAKIEALYNLLFNWNLYSPSCYLILVLG